MQAVIVGKDLKPGCVLSKLPLSLLYAPSKRNSHSEFLAVQFVNSLVVSSILCGTLKSDLF